MAVDIAGRKTRFDWPSDVICKNITNVCRRQHGQPLPSNASTLGPWPVGGKWSAVLPDSQPWAQGLLCVTVLRAHFSFRCPGSHTVVADELEAAGSAAAQVSLVVVAGRRCGKEESGLQSNCPPGDFWKAAISGSRGAEAIYRLFSLAQPSVGDQPGEQLGTNTQLLLLHPHSASLSSAPCLLHGFNQNSSQPVKLEALLTIWSRSLKWQFDSGIGRWRLRGQMRTAKNTELPRTY